MNSNLTVLCSFEIILGRTSSNCTTPSSMTVAERFLRMNLLEYSEVCLLKWTRLPEMVLMSYSLGAFRRKDLLTVPFSKSEALPVISLKWAISKKGLKSSSWIEETLVFVSVVVTYLM
jgi:hypothetical protein